MNKFCLIVLACVVLVGCDTNILGRPVKPAPEVKIVSDPAQAERLRKLEERVDAVETYLQRKGMGFK